MFLHAKKSALLNFCEMITYIFLYEYVLIRIGFSFALDYGAEKQYNLPNGWLSQPHAGDPN